MIGPHPQGRWTNHNSPQSHQSLIPRHCYIVTKPFVDYDKDQHLPGESWIYLGQNFLPYDDGLSLFVSLDGDREWHIRMQWRPEEQAFILENLSDYIREVSAEPDTVNA